MEFDIDLFRQLDLDYRPIINYYHILIGSIKIPKMQITTTDILDICKAAENNINVEINDGVGVDFKTIQIYCDKAIAFMPKELIKRIEIYGGNASLYVEDRSYNYILYLNNDNVSLWYRCHEYHGTPQMLLRLGAAISKRRITAYTKIHVEYMLFGDVLHEILANIPYLPNWSLDSASSSGLVVKCKSDKDADKMIALLESYFDELQNKHSIECYYSKLTKN